MTSISLGLQVGVARLKLLTVGLVRKCPCPPSDCFWNQTHRETLLSLPTLGPIHERPSSRLLPQGRLFCLIPGLSESMEICVRPLI